MRNNHLATASRCGGLQIMQQEADRIRRQRRELRQHLTASVGEYPCFGRAALEQLTEGSGSAWKNVGFDRQLRFVRGVPLSLQIGEVCRENVPMGTYSVSI